MNLKEFIAGPGTKGVPKADLYLNPNGLGIPRSEMPQIPKSAYEEFYSYLSDRGIYTEPIPDFPIGEIRLTQKDINLEKVREMMADLDGLATGEFSDTFVISSDGYLLDGHHRFLAVLYMNEKMVVQVVRVGVPIEELIRVAHEFEGSFTREIHESYPDFSSSLLSFGSVSLEEYDHYREMERLYSEMTRYQKKSRNPKTLYAKYKFLESYQKWMGAVRKAKKMWGYKNTKYLIDTILRMGLGKPVVPK